MIQYLIMSRYCSFNNNFSYENTTQTLTSQLLWVYIDGGLMIAIIFGNSLTIIAVIFCKKLSEILSNQFILSLAVSDLLVGLSLPYHMMFSLCTFDLGFDKKTCLLRFVLIILPCCASLYNLIVIAVDRYISIVHPLHYSRYMNKRKASIVVAVGWIGSIIISTMPVYWNHYETAHNCELEEIVPNIYTTLIITPAFIFVWIIMLILYWKIWRTAFQHARRIRSSLGGSSDWKSVQVVLLVLGSFSICWLPYFAIACLRANGLRTADSLLVYKVAFSLGIANSFMNPLIYAWKNTIFKRAFCNILKCKTLNATNHNPDYSLKHIDLHTLSNKDPIKNCVLSEAYVQNETTSPEEGNGHLRKF